MVEQVPWRTVENPRRAKPSMAVHVFIRIALRDIGCDVHQDYDRKLQSLRRMHRHHTHTLRAFFENRRLGCFITLGLRVQMLNKPSEGESAGKLVSAG